MPIYQCISPEGLLDESARTKLAGEITRIHCDATGVPPSFVNVIFTDVPDGRYFVAGAADQPRVLGLTRSLPSPNSFIAVGEPRQW